MIFLLLGIAQLTPNVVKCYALSILYVQVRGPNSLFPSSLQYWQRAGSEHRTYCTTVSIYNNSLDTLHGNETMKT